jgi:ribosome biogenesis GTPase A
MTEMSDPVEYARMKQANFEQLLSKLKEYPIESSLPPELQAKVNIGFIGITGCGKSSLINTLAQKHVAETGIPC